MQGELTLIDIISVQEKPENEIFKVSFSATKPLGNERKFLFEQLFAVYGTRFCFPWWDALQSATQLQQAVLDEYSLKSLQNSRNS